MVPGGRGREIFRYCVEEELRKVVHCGMLRREGLAPGDSECPRRPDGTWGNFWAIDPKQETINRNKYHGLRRSSLCVINRLIAEALKEAVEPEALKQARRFALCHRYEIYCAAATSPRFLQLTSVFPVLALAILGSRRNWDRIEALHLVKIGAPLRRIADLMDVPMVLRKVKPGVAHLAFPMLETLAQNPRLIETFAQNPRLIDAYMPQSLPRMRFWLRVLGFASRISPDFAAFAAKHTTEVQATIAEADLWFEDTADWVRACLPAPGQPPRPGAEFITRRSSPDMSVKTVTALTHEWHEAVANNMTGPSCEFPEPWAQPGKIGNYEIVSITNNADLYREGNAMHHCVGTYGESVREGRCYVYSLRKDGARVATIELIQFDGRVDLGQIRGPCNSSVPREIAFAVQKWFKSQKRFQLPKKLIRQEIFFPPENPAPRPIIVPPENPAARPIIVPPENRVPEQIIGLPEQQAHSPTPIVCPPATAEPDADELDDPDLCVDDPDLLLDHPDFVVDDDIDGTIDADLAEFYDIGDQEYDEDEYDEFECGGFGSRQPGFLTDRLA
jgi:hypothetical protein